jgi:hypothetical protein
MHDSGRAAAAKPTSRKRGSSDVRKVTTSSCGVGQPSGVSCVPGAPARGSGVHPSRCGRSSEPWRCGGPSPAERRNRLACLLPGFETRALDLEGKHVRAGGFGACATQKLGLDGFADVAHDGQRLRELGARGAVQLKGRARTHHHTHAYTPRTHTRHSHHAHTHDIHTQHTHTAYTHSIHTQHSHTTFTGRSTPYQVGQVWEIEVQGKLFLEPMLSAVLRRRTLHILAQPPHRGQPSGRACAVAVKTQAHSHTCMSSNSRSPQ